MSTLKRLRGKYLLVVLAMCGLVSTPMGIMTNAAGIFFTPIADELRQPTASVNLTLTISNMCVAFAGMLSARWVKPKNFRPAVVGYTLLIVAATALMALCRTLPALYALCALRGYAAGLIGNVLVTSVIGKWFLTDTGFITSLTLGCSGLVGAVFNPVLESVIRTAGWRTAYLVSALIILLFNLPAMAFPIAFLPETVGIVPFGAGEAREAALGDRQMPAGIASGKLLLALTLVSISISSMVAAAPQLLKPLADTYGFARVGIVMMSVVLIVNTAGKFLFGLMTDRIGVRRSILIYAAVIAAGAMLLLLVRVPGAMLMSAAMIGLCYSIPTVGAVMICRELFGPERYGRVFPKMNLGVSVANALGYPILGAIYDRTGRYDGALILVFALILACAAGVSLVYALAYRSRRSK